MSKNYNYERKKLMLPEYGRHVHEMVDYLLTIENRDLRSRQAEIVIDVMGNLNPTLRDTEDYRHKLWDHLFIMADFQLDVDSIYPIPSAETLAPKPDKMKYPEKKVKMKHYGKNVANVIKSLEQNQQSEENKDGELNEQIEETIRDVARYMRTKSYEYNQEHPNNEVIINDIKKMSLHGMDVDEVAIGGLKSDYKQSQTEHQRKGGQQAGRQNRGAKGGRAQSGRTTGRATGKATAKGAHRANRQNRTKAK